MVTNEEIDATLKTFNVDIEDLKDEFATLFPDAEKLLKRRHARAHGLRFAAAATCWLGFKAGYAYKLRKDV